MTPQSHADKIRESMMNDALNDIENIYTSVVTNADTALTTLPEDVFKNTFLHYFFNNEVADDDTLLVKWIHIAGGPMKPVNVVDKNNNILFTVPAIYDTLSVLNYNRKNDISNIVNTARLYKDTLPEESNRILYDELNNAVQHIVMPRKVPHTDIWLEIFKRYKLVQEDVKNVAFEEDDLMLE